jgi:hypothetical protein
MRKFAIVLAAMIAASVATSSAEAQGRKKAAKPDPAIAAQQNTAKLFHDMFRGPQPAPQKAAAAKGKGKKKRG